MSSSIPDGAKRPLRTVTDPVRERADVEMDAIGWGLFLGLAVVLLPLLPFLVIAWLVTKLLDFAERRVR